MSGRALREADVTFEPPAARVSRVSRKRVLTVFASLAIVGGVALYVHHWWTTGRFIESTDDAYVGGDVTVIAPKVAGFIARVAVTDNQAVRAGDLLIKLDDRDYVAALAKARAAVDGEVATLANLEAIRLLQEATIGQARADLDAAAAEVSRARFDADRYRSLSRENFASLQRFQQADADSRKAAAAEQKARAGLQAAVRQLAVIGTRKQQIQAALAGASADHDTARLNLGYTELRAPVDGTVGNRSAHGGSFATVGSQLLSLVPATGLWVDANFKESQLAGLHPGQSVAIYADVLPGQPFHGRVATLAPATGAQFSILPAENATGNFTKIVQRVPVRITLDGEASRLGQLRPGLSVTASVDLRGPAR